MVRDEATASKILLIAASSPLPRYGRLPADRPDGSFRTADASVGF